MNYEIFLNVIAIIITFIAYLASFCLLLLFCQYLWRKYSNPKDFIFHHIIGPPSINLLYYLMISNLFITISTYCMFLFQFISSSTWENYCDQYDVENECELGDHCFFYKSTNNCQVKPGEFVTIVDFEFFALVCMVIIDGIRFCLDMSHDVKYHGYSCCVWMRYKLHLYPEWKSDYYQQKFVKNIVGHESVCPCSEDSACGDCWFCITFWLFYPLTSLFYLTFNGPNINYVEWYILLSLLILSVCNEVFKNYIYKSHKPYNPNIAILYLLTNKFGKNIANLIWTVYTNENNDIHGFDGVMDGGDAGSDFVSFLIVFLML